MSTQPNAQQDVLFYVLNSSDVGSRERFLIKLIKKAFSQKRLIDVRFAQQQDALRFDQTLWCVPEHSYLPHAVAHEIPAPIQLHGDVLVKPSKDVLINLHPDFYPDFADYQRTIEVLDQSEALIEKGRQRWREYKKAGIEPKVHKL